MQKENFEIADIDGEMAESKKIQVYKKSLRNLFHYSNCGLKGLNYLNNSELGLLSKSGKQGVDIAKLSYLNVINELKKIEAFNLAENFELTNKSEINQSVDIKFFVRKLCRRITSVIGSSANLKVRFTSDIQNNTLAKCDGSILQFVLINCIAVIASNISKEKRIINVHLEEADDRVCIKIWNKFAFRLNKKIIDKIDALKMYSSDYEYEQMKTLSNSLVSVMDGSADSIIEDNILKLSVTLAKCDEFEETEVCEFEDKSITDAQILIPFAGVLLKCMCDGEDYNCEFEDLLEILYENIINEVL